MKKLLMTAALIGGIYPAMGGEILIKVPDTFSMTMQNTGVAFERCMGAVVTRGDTSTCQAVQSILKELAGLPSTPVDPPKVSSAEPPKPADAKPVADAKPAEAEKKTSGAGDGKPQ